MQPIRIQKALSEAGVASRRAAEELVRQGRVTINGRKAEIGQSVNPDRDVIAVDGKRVYFARKKQYRYIMMNKPRGYVTTLSDELGRRCVTDLLTGVEERVYPPGCQPAWPILMTSWHCKRMRRWLFSGNTGIWISPTPLLPLIFHSSRASAR